MSEELSYFGIIELNLIVGHVKIMDFYSISKVLTYKRRKTELNMYHFNIKHFKSNPNPFKD